MDWKTPLGIVLFPLLALGLVYALVYFDGKSSVGVTFSQVGNLLKDNPGLEENLWYLSYEERGSPGILLPLVFDHDSRCVEGGVRKLCDMSFVQGERVRVDGLVEQNVLRVRTLEVIR